MSDISDELREFVTNNLLFTVESAKLTAIADRIDEETVELPRDMDGAPIHVGDTVYTNEERAEYTVRCVTYHSDEITIGLSANCLMTYMCASDITHERPDSWGRIADELDDWTTRAAEKCEAFGIEEDALHGFAERIRRLAREAGR